MGLVTQYSRLAHHTIFGLTGSTFSVPATEDFTDGSWTIYDLALSEIGVNETDEKAYIRIGSTIKEFQFTGATGSGGGTVSASNGLSISGGDVILGGTLSQNTVIAGASNSLSFGEIITPSRLRTFGVETYDSIFIRDDDSFNLSVLDMSASGGASILSAAEQITGAGGEFSAGAYGKAHMRATTGSDFFKIELDAESPSDKKMVVTDTITSRGLQYAANYTAQFVTHSLVSKGYVDSAINSATPSLSDVLSYDNYAASYPIRMGSSKIESDLGTSSVAIFDTEVAIDSPIIRLGNTSVSYTSTRYLETLGTTTTNNTPTDLSLFDTSLVGATAGVFSVNVNIHGFCESSAEAYTAKLFAGFNLVNTFTQISITNITELSTFTSSVTSDVFTDGTDIFIQVTGENSKTVKWSVWCDYAWSNP